MTQEKARELLTGLAQTADGRKTRAYEIADRLMSLIRNPHRSQFTGAMQLGQVDRIPPVGLDPISRLASGSTTEQRQRNHARPGSTAVECHSRKGRPHSRTVARFRCATASPPERSRPSLCSRILPYSRTSLCAPRLRKRDRDRILVHVKAHVCDRFVQDPSPMHEARRRTGKPGATLDKPAYCETGRPISGEHVV